MEFTLHFLRRCGELSSKEQSVYEVLRCNLDNIEAICGIESALQDILQAQIQGLFNRKEIGVHQVSKESVSSVCRTLLKV